ncbi:MULTISPECIES: dicarboxylate/amino acid:cation symporter [Cobetia]|uniref:dicarboxylate/amino acid:cation symporter n=1 Tax=Cobetia TaxID=204286 RepID=UPI000986388F|nr:MULTISPECIES: dicarboxylate/amino acid:cation symporter [Cobetia]POR08431.1 sodium:dicarboxylate symporter [Cobetia sp. MM1IDA2H-1]
MSVTRQILLALGLGILSGLALNAGAGALPEGSVAWLDANLLTPVGQIFLRLLQFVVVPMVFGALILSLTSREGGADVGRHAGRLLGSYVVTSAVALTLGMLVAHWLSPGSGAESLVDSAPEGRNADSIAQWLVGLVPNNPFTALGGGGLLQVIFAAALIGLAMRALPEESAPLHRVIESGYTVSLKVLSFVLKLAPLGVFALITSVIATQGLDLLIRLGMYVIGLIIALALMALLYLVLLAVTGARPLAFMRHFGQSLGFAFGTASSGATLPLALGNARDYGMQESLASFALPFGTALKRDGAAVLQGFNALFVAQLFGIDVTTSLVITVFTTGLLVSFSTAGVPGAGLVAMTTVLGAAGLPLEGVAVVAGVDRFTDGLRTALNVMGNCANAALLERFESRKPAAEPKTPA